MVTLITGGAGSGKSAFAEDIAVQLGGTPLIYFATMVAYDGECHEKIQRHREQRAGKGFQTVEGWQALQTMPLSPKTTILVEDLPNWASNLCFGQEGNPNFEQVEKELLGAINCLLACHCSIVVVSNELFSDGRVYPPTTQEFLQMMARLHRRVAQGATAVYEVVAGIPICHKKVGAP